LIGQGRSSRDHAHAKLAPGFQPIAQTRLEFALEFSGVRKHNKANLEPKDIAKLQSFAVKGLEQVFEQMDQIIFDLNSNVNQ
jgi:hypothetical protein